MVWTKYIFLVAGIGWGCLALFCAYGFNKTGIYDFMTWALICLLIMFHYFDRSDKDKDEEEKQQEIEELDY